VDQPAELYTNNKRMTIYSGRLKERKTLPIGNRRRKTFCNKSASYSLFISYIKSNSGTLVTLLSMFNNFNNIPDCTCIVGNVVYCIVRFIAFIALFIGDVSTAGFPEHKQCRSYGPDKHYSDFTF